MSYLDLANAIVIQAAEDYRWAAHTLSKNPDNIDAQIILGQTKRFLKSQWGAEISQTDNAYILKKLEAETTIRKKKMRKKF